MIDPATKTALVETIYYPLRRSDACRGMGDEEVMRLARKVADHIELSGFLVARKERGPGHKTPGE